DRASLIQPELKASLCAYMDGIIRDLEGKAVTINGMADHVHLLLWMPPALSISETLRILKSNSSRWVNQKRGAGPAFAWQTGYGAFSVSHSNVRSVVKYIQAQEKHHRRVSFQEEFVTFLKRNGIRYDEQYIWE
ncbi:MAG: IS200/IS605 family transposase, partial [Acidobacteria bacterium]|nr:IS200/IS605 family transposase [Acidobacteriota bacterium]